MSDYTKSTTFEDKDNLPTGDADKRILGAEVDAELDQIGSVTATKANKVASPTTNNLAKLDGNGDLVDSGYQFSGLTANDVITASAAEINKLDGLTPTQTELNYVAGVTSAIQTQLAARLVAANNLSEITNAATARSNLGLGSLAVQNTIDSSDIDNDAVLATKLETGIMGGIWTNPEHATVYVSTAWTTQEIIDLYIPANATQMTYRFNTSANANGANFRLTCAGEAGTTTTNPSSARAWDAEIETLDISNVAGGWAAINVQSYSNTGTSPEDHQIFEVAYYIE